MLLLPFIINYTKYLFIIKIYLFIFENYYNIPRVAKLRLASHMLIHFKLDYQGAWPPLLYIIIIFVYNIHKIHIYIHTPNVLGSRNLIFLYFEYYYYYFAHQHSS